MASLQVHTAPCCPLAMTITLTMRRRSTDHAIAALDEGAVTQADTAAAVCNAHHDYAIVQEQQQHTTMMRLSRKRPSDSTEDDYDLGSNVQTIFGVN